MTYEDRDDARWSLAGQFMAWALAAETVLAMVAISHPALHGTRVLVAATAVGIGSAVLAARARMPVQAKAGLIAAVCAALLALAAALDPFGLRAIDRRIDAATTVTVDDLAAQTDVAGPVGDGTASSRISLHGRGSTTAAAFADDLARAVVARTAGEGGEFRIDGVIDVSNDAAGDTYRLTWSLSRQTEKLWCGRIVAVGQARDAVIDSFSTTIAAALRRSRGGPMTCS